MPTAGENRFAGYEDIAGREGLAREVRRDAFARAIDAHLPRGVTILVADCGTGRLANFLALAPWRRVVGADAAGARLRVAEDFRRRFEINNAAFVQVQGTRMPFKAGCFDVIIADAARARADAAEALRHLAKGLKPGGTMAVRSRDPGEALRWFEDNGIGFLSGIPGLDGKPVDEGFDPRALPGPVRRALSAFTLRFDGAGCGDARLAQLARNADRKFEFL